MSPGDQNPLTGLDYSVLQQCMHCGMCLPTCPTYVETGRERNSPRGRIALMRSIADGELAVTEAFGEEMYYCLGCLACATACPADVKYPQLFEAARAAVEDAGVLDNPKRDFIRWSLLRVLFTHPRLLRAVGRLLWAWQASGLEALSRRLKLTALLPPSLRRLEPQTPRIARHFSDELIARVETPPGSAPPRFRVAVLTGCIQDLAYPEINRATVDVLLANGCEVVTPRAQYCCGSLHTHNGDEATAKLLARRQLDAIDPAKFDAIITNAGGCGSHLKHYDHLLHDDPGYASRAAEWSRKLKDIHLWLTEIGFRKPRGKPVESVSVTYHESCHLCHGQKVTREPREVLKAIPGVELRECAESSWCCGSAGIYSITNPDTAGWLQQRKLAHLRATKAQVVATANPGCQLQIENGLKGSEEKMTVKHPVVLLAEAYRLERMDPTNL